MAFEWLVFILIGMISGWLASVLVRGRGFGLLGNLVVGVIGALLGGFILGGHVVSGGWGTFITATVGAIVFLLVIKVIKRA